MDAKELSDKISDQQLINFANEGIKQIIVLDKDATGTESAIIELLKNRIAALNLSIEVKVLDSKSGINAMRIFDLSEAIPVTGPHMEHELFKEDWSKPFIDGPSKAIKRTDHHSGKGFSNPYSKKGKR